MKENKNYKWTLDNDFGTSIELFRNGEYVEDIAQKHVSLHENLFNIVYETANAMKCLASKEQILSFEEKAFGVVYDALAKKFKVSVFRSLLNYKMIDTFENAEIIKCFLNDEIKLIRRFLRIDNENSL